MVRCLVVLHPATNPRLQHAASARKTRQSARVGLYLINQVLLFPLWSVFLSSVMSENRIHRAAHISFRDRSKTLEKDLVHTFQRLSLSKLLAWLSLCRGAICGIDRQTPPCVICFTKWSCFPKIHKIRKLGGGGECVVQ